MSIPVIWHPTSLRKLISEFADQVAPRFRVIRGFDAFGRRAVNHAEHTAAMTRLPDDHFYRIRRSTKNITNLHAIADAAQHINRERLANQQPENMSRSDGFCFRDSGAAKFAVLGLDANQAGP